MKALLISPPRFHPLRSNVPSWVEIETGAYPPLGLLYVATAARKWTDWEVSVLDCQLPGFSLQSLAERLRREEPEVVGIQVMTFNILDVLPVVRTVREVLPGAHICAGGPHPHLYPEETLRTGLADSVVLGEGEKTFAALLNGMSGGRPDPALPGLAVMRDGALHLNPPVPLADLDEVPFPDRTMLPVDSYYSALSGKAPITTMMSSRGCPYKCIFCDRPHLGKKFRARSAANVVREMEECASLGIKEIFFYDDTFTIDRERVAEVCDLIRERGLRIEWDIRSRVNTMDRDLLGKLKGAGCRRIHYGVEAGTERVLKVLKKGIRLDRVREVFRWTRETGITSLAYFMIGNPTETREEIESTLAFAREIAPDFIHLSVTTPFPGTELYFRALREGVLERDFWREFALKPDEGFVPPLWTETFTREELIGFLEEGYRRFYLRPGYILRSLLKVRNPSELMRKARAATGLLLSRAERPAGRELKEAG